MKITGWSIEGFGCFRDLHVDVVGPGLTILHGPNEVGKSTLMAFITALLFGFPPRSETRYQPLAGGRHGGRLFLQNEQGEHFTIERFAETKRPTVHNGNAELTEAQWNDLIGHCDRKLYTAVYGFGLAELHKLDGLTDEKLSDRIYSAGIVGAGRAASGALNVIETRTEQLLKPKSQKALINELTSDLDRINLQITTARQESGQYESLLAEMDRLVAARQTVALELTSTNNRKSALEKLLACWPTWVERDEAFSELAHLTFDDRLLGIQSEIDGLSQSSGQFLEWQSRLQVERTALKSASEQLNQNLSDHGPGWDRARLVAADFSQEQQYQIDHHRRLQDQSNQEIQQAEQEVSQRQRECAALTFDLVEGEDRQGAVVAPWSDDEIARAARCIASMRANLTDQMRSENELAVAITAAQQMDRELKVFDITQLTRRSFWPYPFLFLALAFAIGGGWSFFDERTAVALTLAAAAVLSLGIAVAVYRREQHRATLNATQRQEYERNSAKAWELVDDRAELIEAQRSAMKLAAQSMGLPPASDNYDLEDAADFVNNQRALRLQWDTTSQDLQRQRQALRQSTEQWENCQRQLKVRQAAHAKLIGEWDVYRNQALGVTGLPPDLALSFLNQLLESRRILREVERIEAAVIAYECQINGWISRLTAVAKQAGYMATDEPLVQLSGLVAALEQEKLTRQRADEHRKTIESVDRWITQQIGNADSSRTLIDELATGEFVQWQLDSQLISLAIASLENKRQELIDESARCDQRAQQIASSCDLAQFEQERASLVADLHVAWQEWSELQVTAALIRKTLGTYEAERQPAVLQFASERFGSVTNGRYTRVFRQMDDTAKLMVEDLKGGRKGPEALSQGSLEQLYLCIRLGLAAARNERSGELPMLMDDVLVNFDPVRARAVASILAEVAIDQQILFFTCHPESAAMFRECAPDAAVIEMAAIGSSNV